MIDARIQWPSSVPVLVRRLAKKGVFDFEYEVTGVHGGASNEGKFEAYLRRCRTNYDAVRKRDVGCAFSLSSPECARVAYGLNIPHICTSDSPFSQAASLLTFPLSAKIITSWLSNIDDFVKVGADPEKIVTFQGIDEIAWTRDYEPDPGV